MEKKFAKHKIRNSVKGMDVFLWILFAIVGIYVISMLFILYFGLVNSIKGTLDFGRGNLLGFPSSKPGDDGYGWKFSNYIKAFYEIAVSPDGIKDISFIWLFVYSMVYSVLMSLFTIATQVMVAYAVSKFKFYGKGILYTVAIIVMIIPIVGSLASEMQLMNSLHLNNSFIGVCILRCKYPGLYFLVFYAAFKSVSWTYAEAAQIDGAGHWRIFLTLMLPIISSTIFAIFVLQFIANFNDYYTPMVFLPNYPTLSYGLYYFGVIKKGDVPLTLAGCILTCIPMLIIFVIFRNKIMGNVNVGGIKG